MCIRDSINAEYMGLLIVSMAEKKEATKPGDKVTISAKRKANFYVNIAKQALSNFEKIELHALGSAIGVCITAAESLAKFGYATMTKINCEAIELEGRRPGMKMPKMIIILTRTAGFKTVNDKANAVKKENETAYGTIFPTK
eukprot:TRINITY_DN621_c0_g1_i1.p1 TRINITY_DN621_c0_g1~~TRINITY_DN621_c0_g1_i1.p1  ORF type:complete len:142 (-),score=62.11 TRINITY_DN621_c0_g1_i1:47-472(-)